MNSEDKSIASRIYDDIFSPPARAIGDAFGSLINAYIAQPLKQFADEKYKKNIGKIQKRIEDKIILIPEENRKEPDVSIVGPALEEMKFHIEKDDYVEMFTNLLAKACDSREKEIHPSFSSIIKQLSPEDAKLLKIISDNYAIPIIELEEQHTDGSLTPYFGYYTLEYVYNVFDSHLFIPNELMVSIDNLCRLQLVFLNSHIISRKEEYEGVKNNSYYKSITTNEIHFKERRYRAEMTRLGARFVAVCVRN